MAERGKERRIETFSGRDWQFVGTSRRGWRWDVWDTERNRDKHTNVRGCWRFDVLLARGGRWRQHTCIVQNTGGVTVDGTTHVSWGTAWQTRQLQLVRTEMKQMFQHSRLHMEVCNSVQVTWSPKTCFLIFGVISPGFDVCQGNKLNLWSQGRMSQKLGKYVKPKLQD